MDAHQHIFALAAARAALTEEDSQMGKLKNVTAEELEAARIQAEDLTILIADLHDRAEKGYCDTIEKPATLARTFAYAARSSAQLAGWLLFKMEMQEDKATLQRLLKERQKMEEPS